MIYRISLQNVKKILLMLVISCFFMQVNAQNELVSIQSISDQEFEVRSLNGIPFTVVLEESNSDGQFHLGINNSLTFKVGDMIGKRSTVRIVFEDELYHSLENKLIKQYQTDLQWIENLLGVKEGEFKKLPSRPVFTEAGLEKLKGTVFEYVNTDQEEEDFYKWIEKINYSVGAVKYFRDLFAASNGESNEQRRHFLPINVYNALQGN
ncbi:hypothetical protein ATE84_4031 [Aquimarina sp. MAR_2010_214]|uniref:hypothetical protein n=1 Tax=Aquimarina sp. MAR_2010_214 TaxID=1250026 RepID=UPI000CBAAF6E|nr:hypothetical protein [Aquimarina sp. MAR_2010_214]PKV51931.1 hypothetical protein ATE84_4031 [Aquimarina sp. MAR_2010_214]